MNCQDTRSTDFSMSTGPRPGRRWRAYVPRRRLTRRRRRAEAAAVRVRSLLALRAMANDYRHWLTSENGERLDAGLTGLLTPASTTRFTAPTGRQASALWRRKTADEIALDLKSFFTGPARGAQREARKHRRRAHHQARRARINRRGWA